MSHNKTYLTSKILRIVLFGGLALIGGFLIMYDLYNSLTIDPLFTLLSSISLVMISLALWLRFIKLGFSKPYSLIYNSKEDYIAKSKISFFGFRLWIIFIKEKSNNIHYFLFSIILTWTSTFIAWLMVIYEIYPSGEALSSTTSSSFLIISLIVILIFGTSLTLLSILSVPNIEAYLRWLNEKN